MTVFNSYPNKKALTGKSSQSLSEIELREERVGLTEFVFKAEPSFRGIIKQNCFDFLVNEIDLDGNVVRLTDLSIPEYNKQNNTSIEPLSKDDFIRLIGGEDIYLKLSAFKESFKTSVVEDKEERRRVHDLIKINFPALTSVTQADKSLIISKANKLSDDLSSTLAFCGFHLYKENRDTMDAIGKISRSLNLHQSLFKFAGTKDKQAITVQRVVVSKVNPKKILKINDLNCGMNVGNFFFPKASIGLGDLGGNRFTVVIRSLEVYDNSLLEESLKNFRDKGFVNYYGLQRFGSGVVLTHEVGQCIVLGKWKEAVDLIMAERPSDNVDVQKAKEYWKNGLSSEVCLASFPKSYQSERAIIHSLAKHPENYCTAIQAIPRSLRQLYGHAFQSYIWNNATSKRLQTYGMKPVVGDLVLLSSGSRNRRDDTVIVLDTEQMCLEYSIYDVVLPLPGYDIQYPTNSMKEFYKDILADFSESAFTKKIHKELSLHGAHRHILAKPSNVSWETKFYDDDEAPLVLSDLSLLNNVPEPIYEGTKLALVLKFDLKPSQYATVAFREILKTKKKD